MKPFITVSILTVGIIAALYCLGEVITEPRWGMTQIRSPTLISSLTRILQTNAQRQDGKSCLYLIELRYGTTKPERW